MSKKNAALLALGALIDSYNEQANKLGDDADGWDTWTNGLGALTGSVAQQPVTLEHAKRLTTEEYLAMDRDSRNEVRKLAGLRPE